MSEPYRPEGFSPLFLRFHLFRFSFAFLGIVEQGRLSSPTHREKHRKKQEKCPFRCPLDDVDGTLTIFNLPGPHF